MIVLKLAIVFAIILGITYFKKPLYIAILLGALAVGILFKIPVSDIGIISFKSLYAKDTLLMIFSIYFITFLQKMMEDRDALMAAQRALSRLFNNRRINASVSSMFIGLMPSPPAVLIAGEIVDNTTEDYLDNKEKAFVASYFRHIPEAFMPTYSSIILAITLSGVSMPSFIIGMLPLVTILIILGLYFGLRKVPRDTGEKPSENKKMDWLIILRSLWPIGLAIIIILVFNLSVPIVVMGIIALYFFIGKFNKDEMINASIKSVQLPLIFNTFAIMILKNLFDKSGVISLLPEILSTLPIPMYLIFMIIFFLGTVISGSSATIGIGIPLAFLTFPEAGMPLLVMLMSTSYAASQISPTHICLAVVTEYFDISIVDLIKKTLPIVIIFIPIIIIYYNLLIKLV